MNTRRKAGFPAILIIALLTAAVIACLPALKQAAAAFLVCLIVLLLNWKSARKSLGNFARANFFIIFIWLITPLTARGQPVLEWHFFHVSLEGIKLCALITLKSEAILMLFISLLGGRNMFEVGRALSVLRCPAKLVWLFLLMERNVHLLMREWQKLSAALKLRGFRPGVNMRTYSAYAALLGLLLMRAHAHGQAQYEAMLLSGYNGKLPFRDTWHPGIADYLAISCSVLVCVLLVFFDRLI